MVHGCAATHHATAGEPSRIPRAAGRMVRALVEVCQRVHEALVGGRRYVLHYLQQPVAAAVSGVARQIGRRACQLHAEPAPTTGGTDVQTRDR